MSARTAGKKEVSRRVVVWVMVCCFMLVRVVSTLLSTHRGLTGNPHKDSGEINQATYRGRVM